MELAAGEHVVRYLTQNQDELINAWLNKIIVEAHDPYKKDIQFNGLSMITLVMACLTSGEVDENQLKQLAHTVASERLKANINIGEFVYNVNVGRSEILEQLPSMGRPIDDLRPVIVRINVCFDKFLYFAVQHYTELKNHMLDEQSSLIEQTHKDHLTILGQMSSSFVHEFRNPLTSVLGFVHLLQERYPTLEYLDVLTKELNQLKFRINQFLLVSKKGIDHKEQGMFQIASIFDETLDFLYPMVVASDVSIQTEIDKAIWMIGYRDEFRQVLINILMNSLEALSETQVKLICIRGYAKNDMAIITISNNGPVISKDAISSIFEPSVSTKKLGTGIGLYICRKIISDHHGTIDCQSDADRTTFQMRIPLAK